MDMSTRIKELVEQRKEMLYEASDRIWNLAETKFEEYESAELLSDILEQEGFHVERGVGGIETAFIASYGQGKPVIAILGEYDALSGMSQKGSVSNQEPIVSGGNGHGCGHNLLGVGSLGAALAVKELMIEEEIHGQVRYYGCPAEEGGSGKTYMVREGLFDDVDVALTWHPGDRHSIMEGSALANYQIYYKFKGTSSHAAISPHLGRSALDAVELMNVGVNYLREHIVSDARVHYAITNTGGNSPNVVQSEAEVLYLMRAQQIDEVASIYERINNIARGAALMTETEVDIVFDKACSNVIPNPVLNEIFHKNFKKMGTPEHTENEQLLAEEIKQTIPSSDKLAKGSLSNKLDLYEHTGKVMSASTDVGDVSWVTPTAQCEVACFATGTQYHSWQMVSQGATSVGKKGMVHASKVIASTALDLFTTPEKVIKVKEEWQKRLKGRKYISPIPADIKPNA